MRLVGLGKLKKSTSTGLDPVHLPVCSIVLQPTTASDANVNSQFSVRASATLLLLTVQKLRRTILGWG
jgi:hypothetical protein